MQTQPNIQDWNTPNTPNTTLELVQRIQVPLSSIIAANNKVAKQMSEGIATESAAKITLENSQKIADLIAEVVERTNLKGATEKEPLIFELYRNNPRIQAMCSHEIDPKKVSKTDKKWLLDLEKVVFQDPNPDQLSVFGLAFEVAVSERQLHRNIKKFLALSPNKYVRILKLHKAKQLLEEYAYRTISEVAYAVGFQDAHYFSKLFYQQYGALPKELLPS